MKLEETAQAQSQDLKEFFRAELALLESRLEAKLEGLRADFHHSLHDQLLKFVMVLIAALSVAVAIIKLFPNAP